MAARRTTRTFAVVALTLGSLAIPTVGGAAPAQAQAQRFGTRAHTAGAAHLAGAAARADIVGAHPARRRAVFVQFTGAGAAAAFRTALHTATGTLDSRDAAAQHAALARRTAVRRTGDAVFAAASAVDPSARELWHVGNALPGMALVAGPRAIAAIAARSDVVKVSTLVPKRPASANTAALTRALDTWRDPGMTGRGVTVGVIDTGLDYTHADFGGVGTSSAYDAALADDTDPGWHAALPTLGQAKIAGGYDLAGDGYDAGSGTHDVPAPDPNPLDCSGHGTQVAGPIAGYGVNGDGTTFSSDDYADLDNDDLLAMRVGPGMAPDAELYPLKIFGCGGSSDLLIPALDRALDPNHDGDFTDRLDIVDIALTSDYATPDDPDSAEVNAVADAGVLPVVAIGNGGDATDAGGAPADATRAIAVASSVVPVQGAAETLSSFSARGPHGSLGVIKPDVTAPGDTIASAGMSTGSGVSVASGTSLAAAHVAGIAALVDQTHRGWSAEELKAAVMNTADHDIHVTNDANSAAYGPARIGAGRVDALNAVTTPLLAFNNDVAGGVSASFGVVTAPANVTSMTRSQTIRVENTGDTDETAAVHYVSAVGEPGVHYAIQGLGSDDTLTVRAHTVQLLTVTMTVRSSALRHTIDPTMSPTTAPGGGVPAQNRQYLSDASGRVVITPSDSTLPPLRVPVYGAARPASTLAAVGGTDEILRSGTSFDQGPSTPDSTTWTSFAVPMSLDATSKRLPVCSHRVTAGCTANQTAQGGDIRYVGSSSFPGKSHGKPSLANGYFYIGISTYGDNATLGHAVQPEALIYLKGHTSPDFESYVADLPGTDILLNNLVDLKTGRTVDQEFVNWEDGSVDTNVFDTNTVIMPIWLAALGVHDNTTTLPLKFTVREASRYAIAASGVIDSVGPVSVDAVDPAVSVGVTPGLVPLFDGNGPLPTDVSRPHTKALVFFLHNPDDRAGDNPDTDRDQVVTVEPRPTAFNIHVPGSVRYGHAAQVSGTLREANGAAINRATVTLAARRPGDSRFQAVATAKTDGHGAVSATVHPKKNTRYRWQWAGAAGNSAVTSAAHTVSVHQVVTIDAKPASAASGTAFELYGTTDPPVGGARVRIQQRKHGRWHTIRTVTTREQQLPNGVYEAGYKSGFTEKSAGSYSFRAIWPATRARAGGTSKVLQLTVR